MSDSLRVPLSAVAEGLAYTVDVTVNEADLRPKGATALALSGASLTGNLSVAGVEFLFGGSVSADIRHACDRCLEVAERRFTQDVDWAFAPGPVTGLPESVGELEALEAEGEDVVEELVRHFEGAEIDLAPPLWEELVLMAPTKFLCDDECKGLCPQCGANRNSGDCGCVSETDEKTGHRGLAALKDLFPGLGGGSSEE